MGRHSTLCRRFAVLAARNPGFLFLALLEAAVVCILMFGVEIVLSDGEPIEFGIFGSRIDALVLVTSRLVPAIAALGVAGLTAIFIIGFSGTFLDMLEDPLLPMYLAGGVGRSRLMVNRAIAILSSLAVQLGVFGMTIGATLSVKAGQNLFLTPLLGVFSLLIGFMLALSFAAALSMIVPERTAVIVSTLLIYFGVAPAVRNLKLAIHPVLGILCHLLPPSGGVSTMAQEAFGGNGLSLKISFQACTMSAAYMILATLLFRRKDL